ncbi:efflux RND transporter periplasmic adaptor subunit [bacterium]|nr:MAG: efflux RND transporter periplasmic adaptor subunit [bacterium]
MRNLSLIGLAAALLLSACAPRHAQPTSQPAVAVGVASARPVRSAARLEVTGTLRARELAVVAAQQPGRVTSMLVREGDYVGAGQALAIIDRATYAAQAGSASAAGSAAKAAVDAANFEVQAARAASAGSSAKAENARLRAQRFESLYAQGAVSRQERDDAAAAAAAAVAELASAHAAEASARAHSAVAAGEAAAAGDRSTLAQVTLRQTTVTAPFDGIITKRWLDSGAYANAGSPIATVESSRQLELDLSIPEDAAATLAPGATVPVRIDAWRGGSLTGRMRALVPDDGSGTHAYTAILEIAYRPGLLPGMFARAEIAGRPLEGIAIPVSALITRAGQSGAFLVEGHRARFQPVTLLSTEGTTAIVSGLAGGTAVVRTPDELSDGEEVAVQ